MSNTQEESLQQQQQQDSASQQSRLNNIPKLKFAIQGLNCELPQSLSYRRNSAMQSLLMTTTSLNSTLQSARAGQGSSTLEKLQTQVNLENTQELKAFATVDLVKINKERQNQLKLALEDNLKEKEKEFREVEASYQQHKNEYDKISQKFNDKSIQLENQIKQQKEYLINLKEELRELDTDLAAKESEFHEYKEKTNTSLTELQTTIDEDNKGLKSCEAELQVLQVQKKGLQMGIDMQRKVKLQELDMKIQPLKEEHEKMQLNIEMLGENLALLQDVKSQNENEKMMIEEDLAVSESIKVELVLQREELEECIETAKSQNYDLNFILSGGGNSIPMNWQESLDLLVYDKQKGLLIDLIRELQQYILGMSSGTTDNSTIQSDELEDLQMMIEQGTLQNLEEAVDLIVEFAHRKIKLNLNQESLKSKLESVYDQIEIDQLQQALNEVAEIERQMRHLDCRIKVVTNRCQNELKPRQRALMLSESQLDEEIEKAQKTLEEIKDYAQELENEIKNIKLNFEQNYQTNQEDIGEIEEKLGNLSEKIQEIEYHMDNLKSNLQQNEIVKIDLLNERSLRETEFDQYKQTIVERQNELREEIRRERQQQNSQGSMVNPVVEELSMCVAQLKCDKESAQKRLKYIENKLQNAKDSVQHAKSVLENHILQAQQESLHQKVNSNFSMNHHHLKRASSGTPSTIAATGAYGQTQSTRINNIQSKAVSLAGANEILSPSKEGYTNTQRKRKNSTMKERQSSTQKIEEQTNENDTMHSHYIDSSQSDIKKELQRTYTCGGGSTQKAFCNQSQQQEEYYHQQRPNSNQENYPVYQNAPQVEVLQKKHDKSTIDIVKYYYDSSSAISSHESDSNGNTDKLSNHYLNFNNNNQRQIPCQSLITPREVLQEIQGGQELNKRLSRNFIYDSAGQQQPSLYTQDSISSSGSSKFERKNSLQSNDSLVLQNPASSHLFNNSNHLVMRNQKIVPLKSHQQPQLNQNNTSFDGKPLKNVVVPLYSQFKENIMPLPVMNPPGSNFNQNGSCQLNMRKLSQVSNLSQFTNNTHNQSILNSFVNNNRPPAVPQSKNNSNLHSHPINETPRGSSQKANKRFTLHQASSSNSRNSLDKFQTHTVSQPSSLSSTSSNQTTTGKTFQTKMKLCMNQTHGKILQVGVVDLARCNQSTKDIQFFEAVKPLVEGASFLVLKDDQYVLKQMYLDLSLLRFYLTNFNGEKEILMLDSIIKPELPQSTLDAIKQDKANAQQQYSQTGTFAQQNNARKYEFNLILNNGTNAERMQLLATNYEELRLWIIGMNALIGSKTNLMRLSSLIIN